MWSLADYLRSSETVASAQHFFGIEAFLTNENNFQNTSNGLNHQQNGLTHRHHNDSNGINPESANNRDCTNNVTYKIKNYFFYYLFAVGANLGNEVFYITFLPFCFWNVDASVGRRLCLLWCVFMYIGQATKDWLKIPRPSSPPVVHLEDRYCLEYGMPSTHAMVAAGFPFAIYLLTVDRYVYSTQLYIAGGIIWCLVICGSRIYLGMHSFLDVLAGVIYSIIIIAITHSFLPLIEHLLLKSLLGLPLLIILPFTLLYVYPSTPYWSSTKGDTSIILGVTMGLVGTHRVMGGMGLIVEVVGQGVIMLYSLGGFGFWGFLLATARCVVGLGLIVALRFVFKYLSERLVRAVLNISVDDSSPNEKLELPRKFLTYFFLAFAGFLFIPLVFRAMNIHRESFFVEFSS